MKSGLSALFWRVNAAAALPDVRLSRVPVI
jgi:hypothetical protein